MPERRRRLPERQRGDSAFCSLIKRLNGGFLAKGSHFAWLIEA